MAKEIRIYFEGDRLLRPGFREFLREFYDRAGDDYQIRLIEAKGNTCRDFGIALKTHPDARNILLKDTEGPISEDAEASLCRKHNWDPAHSRDIFWMVEMMESWFHADKDALEKYYRVGFRRAALKANPKVENISKQDLTSGLSAATKNTLKGDYFDHKTSHGPKLLEAIDPKLVCEAAPHCRMLFDAIRKELSP